MTEGIQSIYDLHGGDGENSDSDQLFVTEVPYTKMTGFVLVNSPRTLYKPASEEYRPSQECTTEEIAAAQQKTIAWLRQNIFP